MCDCQKFTPACPPSSPGWELTLLLVGVVQTVGRSRPPSQRQSSRHWVKAHTDAQSLLAPPHKHRRPCNLPQMDTWGQSHLLCADYLSSPLQAPDGGKRDAQRKSKWVPESNGWCCAASHWKPPLQHSKKTAGHCTNAGTCPHALFLRMLKMPIPIPLECDLVINVPGRRHLPERRSLNTSSFNTPPDLLVWYDWFNDSGDLSSYDHTFPL